MNFSTDINTTVLKFESEGKVIYAKTIWVDNENEIFHVKIFDDINSWSGAFSKQFAKECRIDAVEDVDEYYNNVKTCLSSFCDKYSYEFKYTTENSNCAIFRWKKFFEGTTTAQIHGSVDLIKDHVPESKDSLIDFLLNENLMQRKVVQESQENITQLKLEIDKLKSELTKFVQIKNSLEDDLYGKFVSLLNTKKQRIQVLEDHLHKCESN